ncbi:phosphate ABC transporter substrate-binding protein PstS [Acetobacter lambici]|uniref:Phosphate-binding protein PstS n=1 Tax=Acetobacter lambici TaxID=1332824 RepID=A0ABT1EW77_9PROT|nr:phosphate ABC transporter substrate-binding protein PstS [Acetobacter lambici]MCP1241131.1 phosphate ABC transporter substrate-binding protein PstS [Acetobacter lambici]MCP1257197.1 phosphate ABC transporter substrate-binding protein PstS [Acetobacter lambici]
MAYSHLTHMRCWVKAGFAALLLCGGFTLPHAARAESITGAGSSFAAPLYQAWSAAAPSGVDVRVNYQTIGSGAGQNQILAGTVDFGASDAPMVHARLEAGKLVQVPTAIGGVVITANVPGIANGALRLSGPVLADIYAGSITQWNDARIAALNPDLHLPDQVIAPLHRADGSGTTYVFTDYLAHVSPQWKEGVGKGTSVAWPAGAGARGNDGIAAYVQNTAGSIGYLEYAYAERNHLALVQMQNHAGFFVSPSASSFAQAAQAAQWDEADLTAALSDVDGAQSWPIITTTYVLLPATATADNQGDAVRRFFRWGLVDGATVTQQLDYVPLPEQIRARALRRLGAE